MGNDIVDAVIRVRKVYNLDRMRRSCTLYNMNEENLDNVEVQDMLSVGL